MAHLPSSCPVCGTAGPAAAPCPTPRCQRGGYHCVPDAWLDDRSGVLDGLIGQKWQDVLLVRRLGSGGVGAIYLALQMPLMMKVAVKFLTDGAPAALAAKLRDEALALSRLHHHHIVRLLKYGEIHQRTFLVMEFVDGGRTLADAMERGELDRPARVGVLRQLIEALEAAHAFDVVHRDVKPENIMLQRAPRDPHFVKLVDFGLAKFIDGGRESTQIAAGTPTYMAPEQITRRNIGPWTDWYAVAMIALELLLDHRPYAHMSTDEVVRAKMSAVCDPTRGLAERGLPPAVSRFFHLALATDPHNRLRSAPVFRDAFNAMVDNLPAPEPVLEPTMAGRDLPELRALLAGMPDPEARPLRSEPPEPVRPAFREAHTMREREPEPTREHGGRHEVPTQPGRDSGPVIDPDGSLDDGEVTAQSISLPAAIRDVPSIGDDEPTLEPEDPLGLGPPGRPASPYAASPTIKRVARGPTVHVETRVSAAPARPQEEPTRPRAQAPRPGGRRHPPEPPPTLLSSAGRLSPGRAARRPGPPPSPPPSPPSLPPSPPPASRRPPPPPTARLDDPSGSGEVQAPRMTLRDPGRPLAPARQTRADQPALGPRMDHAPTNNRRPPAPPARPVRQQTHLVDPFASSDGTHIVDQTERKGWHTLMLVLLLIGVGVLMAVIWLLLNPPLATGG